MAVVYILLVTTSLYCKYLKNRGNILLSGHNMILGTICEVKERKEGREIKKGKKEKRERKEAREKARKKKIESPFNS